MNRYLRLALVGLVSVALALGFTTTGATAAPKAAAAVSQSCATAQTVDAQNGNRVAQKAKKLKKAKKKFNKAKKAEKKASTFKNKKAVKKAKAKKKKAKKQLRKAKKAKSVSSVLVSTSCTTTTTPTPTNPNVIAPGTVSPFAPICEEIPELAQLCTLSEQGRTQLCQQLAPLTAVPGVGTLVAQLCAANPTPAQLKAVIDQLRAAGGDTLLGVIRQILNTLLGGLPGTAI